MKLEEKTLSESYAFKGKIINLRVDTVLLPDDSTATREVVEHNGGICVLPLDGHGNIYFVKQWRQAYKQILTEIPAGKRDGDEAPLECGKRELKEEIGAVAEEYTFLGEFYPTPGYCEEVIYIYLAKGLTFGETNPDEGEFLNIVKIPAKKAVKMVLDGEIKDGKTSTAILKADLLGYFD